MIYIDGSFGEGGGQILRTSLGLSMVTGKEFCISNIRKNRRKPGLLRQHLTAVNAAKTICGAETQGAELKSEKLDFSPGKIIPGQYEFEIGSAGSTSLVFQTIYPALLYTESESRITITGGTHNPYAPPFDFLKESFLPLIGRMGISIIPELIEYGFYPAGGGKAMYTITPPAFIKPLFLTERGKLVNQKATGIVSGIPEKIAEKEVNIITKQLNWGYETETVLKVKSRGPGNFLYAALEYENVTEFFTSFGEKRISLNKVAADTIKQIHNYQSAEAPFGEYLTDQVLIPMALSGGGKIKSVHVSEHAKTNIEVIKQFLDVEITIKDTENNEFQITIKGDPYGMG